MKPGRLPAAWALVSAVVFLGSAALSQACDVPAYKVARTDPQWMLEPHALHVAYQPGNFDSASYEKLVERLTDGWLKDTNLLIELHDLTYPVTWISQRRLLAQAGIFRYPLLVLTDADGKPTAHFQTLAEARDLLSPKVEGELRPYGAPEKIELKGKPGRLLIIYDSQLTVGDDDDRKAAPVPTRQRAQRWADALAKKPLPQLAADTAVKLVDLRQPGDEQALIGQLKLRPLPVCIWTDPDFEVVNVFDNIPDEAELRRVVFSPTRDRIVELLMPPALIARERAEQEQAALAPPPGFSTADAPPTTQPDALAQPPVPVEPAEPPDADPADVALVLLFVRGTDNAANASAIKVCREVAAEIGKLRWAGRIEIVELDPRDPRETYLLKQLHHEPGREQPTVAPIMGRGKLMDLMGGQLRAEDLYYRVQWAFHPCGCDVTPRQFGLDLLIARSPQLARGEPPPAPFAEAKMASRLWVSMPFAILGGLVLLGAAGVWLRGRNGTGQVGPQA